MPITSISSVWYPIADWELAKNFYSNGLGLRLTECDDEEGWASYQISEEDPAFFLVRRPEMAGEEAGGVVTFEASEIEGLLERIVAFGGEVDEEVQVGETVNIYTVYDPDGNVLEIAEVNPIGR
jgi:predicted enzyme related to lactoylglutathione lyase